MTLLPYKVLTQMMEKDYAQVQIVEHEVVKWLRNKVPFQTLPSAIRKACKGTWVDVEFKINRPQFRAN